MSAQLYFSQRAIRQIFFIALGILLLATACSQQAPDATIEEHESNPQYSSSYISAYTLKELVDRSEIIVIGKAAKSDETINMSRNPLDPSQPDSQTQSLGQVYTIHPQQYLKGKGPKRLKLIQVEAVIEIGLGTPVSPKTIERAKANYHYAAIDQNKEYMFFLQIVPGYPGAPYFIGTAEPSIFDLSDPNAVKAVSPWEGAQEAFPNIQMDSFLKNVQTSVRP